MCGRFGARCIGTSSTSIPKFLNWFGHSSVFSILSPRYKHWCRTVIVVTPFVGSSYAVTAVAMGIFSMISNLLEFADTFVT